MPKIFIDNLPYEVKAGKNLLESCLTLGFDLPYFCWHPAMGSVGACRQCAVKVFKDENDQRGRLAMSCMENVTEGMRLSVKDPVAKAFREQVIEWLMTNHPHDCPVCDEGGSCQLQDMTVMTGHDYRRYHFKKRTYRNQYLGPLVHHEMNRCIQCYRCVRYYRDYAGGDDLNVFGAHNHVYFGRAEDGILESPFSGNLAEVCPTGVFTDKTLKQHYTRKWDLTSAASVCHHCSLGCNIFASERYGKLRCVTNRYNGEVNGYFLCDRGRFGYEFVNSENRITQPLIRTLPVEAVNEETMLDHLVSILPPKKLLGIGSARASVESNYALQQLVGKENFYQGVSEAQAQLEKLITGLLVSGEVHSCSMKDVEQADAVLVLGEDIWNTAPMLALAVRQAVMKTAAAQATQQVPLSSWNDAAIKELVQDKKGFLGVLAIAGSPLEEIATTVVHAAPDDLARLGFAVAGLLGGNPAAVPALDEDAFRLSEKVATALQHAKNPVIISGTSGCSEAMIKAAFRIAAALNKGEKKAGITYVFPDCNSLGLAMMQAPSLDKAFERVKREECTAIVLEQDIYRCMPADKTDEFFRQCGLVVVLDSLHSRTTNNAQVLIPAATFAEADGTLVNNEGRAQRFFQVFVPSNHYIRESWRWLCQMAERLSGNNDGRVILREDLLLKMEQEMPVFSGISGVSPPADFRIFGQLIPREPHRYSGRTAILANVQVSEPKPRSDQDSPLTFTMEGYNGLPPSSTIPFYWAPGWNSPQSVHKYQEEAGGPLKGGNPGIRLLREETGKTADVFTEIPQAFQAAKGEWLLLPKFHLFGSGELGIYTSAIRQLSADPVIIVSKEDAGQLNVTNGSVVTLKSGNTYVSLPIKIQEELATGIVLVSKGLPGMEELSWGSRVRILNEQP